MNPLASGSTRLIFPNGTSLRIILWINLGNTLMQHRITSALVAVDGGGHQIVRMSKAIEDDERVTVCLSSSLRRQLKDVWLAAYASDT